MRDISPGLREEIEEVIEKNSGRALEDKLIEKLGREKARRIIELLGD